MSVSIFVFMNRLYFSNFLPILLMPCDILLENGTFYYYTVTVEIRFSSSSGFDFFFVLINEGYSSPLV